MTRGRWRWWLDERAHAGDEHLDERYVAGYDRKAGFDPADDVEVLRRHGVGSGSVVVDLGAGTGTFTAAVASLCERVIAVDVSPAMVTALRARVDDLGLANVTVVEAGFLTYEHEGPPADAVYTRNALHQVPDFWKAVALDRIADLLRPGGVLRLRDLVYDFAPGDAGVHIESWLAGAVDDPAVGWTAGELAQHVRTEFSTYAWLLDAMLDRCGFEIVDRSFRRSAYGTYTCVRR
ncbi:MAG TPA: class I SAM-dependent methyltransferase [Acidimicrobiales bacterium]|nr:class I SAM-dependent methyltransferase [Acidimicrobiales bacterium]